MTSPIRSGSPARMSAADIVSIAVVKASSRIGRRWSRSLGPRLLAFLCRRRADLDDGFLHVAQLIFAEEHFLADEEGRRTERSAIDGVLREFQQAVLHVRLLRSREQVVEIDIRGNESLARDLRVVHLF